ncbi:LysR family transcriptional regulator [Sphingopyxis indica]|uniref:LysR family transcriptional regulator n=1 Tax=Sphingopyxis indica TaxID=436663 RepID=UPI0029391B54|nr:LysR family transcriptional regulator [Sphingopyxis indica]
MAALVATARSGSVTRAARQINLTQPALTQAIAGLERELDCTLFERAPDGMKPTEPALLLIARAETALALIGSWRVTSTQLRAFLAVAGAGGYAGAAEETGLAAASLHRAVSDLTVALGQRLIEKRGRTIALTPAGLRRARAFGLARAELRSGLDEVARWQGKAAGSVTIGAMPLSRSRWLPQVLLIFARAYPDVGVRVVEGSHSDLSPALRDGEIDMLLGAVRDGPGVEDLVQEAVFDDRPRLVCRTGHPLAKCCDPQELAKYDWVMPGPDTPLRHYWQDMFAALGLDAPEVKITCGSILTIRELLIASDMMSMASPAQLRVELQAGLLVAIEPPVPVMRRIGITTRIGWRPTEPQAAMLDLLREKGRLDLS